MSGKAERLQDAIGLVKDEYVLEAHGDEAVGGGEVVEETTAETAAGAKAVADAVESAAKAKSADNGAAGTNGGQEQKPAKVIQMPEKKRRRVVAPIAAAACLALAVGVGALALGQMNKPAAEEASPAAAASTASEKGEAETSYMAMDATADGAVAETYAPGRASSDLAPAQPPFERVEGEAFVLTAAEWNDNDNWAFFTNLVNSGTIAFPSFGLDPTGRVKATIVDAAGNPVRGEEVELLGASGEVLWRGVSGKDGAAYLFYDAGKTPQAVSAGGVEQPLSAVVVDADGQQGAPQMRQVDDVTVTVGAARAAAKNLQVMFIVDTTGSMSDEIAYLQKDFASIAGDVGADGVEYSVNFYRDKGDNYVTKCNGFTSDVSQVQSLLNAEYADGGGDTPEAVAEILTETITDNGDWRSDSSKVAFLIFDAPPHDGTDAVIEAAVRSAATRGIRLVPVVASNADRETELFGRALAIMTGATYVFLTDDSGVGESHLEPIVGDYSVERLHDVIVRIIENSK